MHQINKKILSISLSLIACGAFTTLAHAQSDTYAISIVGVGNSDNNNGIDEFQRTTTTDGSVATASTSAKFTGLDGNGNTQTMGFSATTSGSASFLALHSETSVSVTNTYYNANNPDYTGDATTGTGSPDNLDALGFAGFDDTLHFGGTIKQGYTASYIFQVEGGTTGNITEYTGNAATLGVTVGGNNQGFFAFGQGNFNETWATTGVAVTTDPTAVNVQFSTQALVDTQAYADGSNISGTSNYMDTLKFVGIEMFDANGNEVSGWTVTADSGTTYNQILPAPEPCSMLLMAGAIGGIVRRKLRSK